MNLDFKSEIQNQHLEEALQGLSCFFYKTVHFWIFHLKKLEKLEKSENLNIAAQALISICSRLFC